MSVPYKNGALYIISMDTCCDWFQRTYVLTTAQKNLWSQYIGLLPD